MFDTEKTELKILTIKRLNDWFKVCVSAVWLSFYVVDYKGILAVTVREKNFGVSE